MMGPRVLDVSLAGQGVGRLEMNRSGLVTWIPDLDWEARGQRPPLGAAFFRTPGPRAAGTGLPAWFENLLPEDGSALRQRLCAVHGLREGNRFQLIAAIGGDLSGAVEVHLPGPTRERVSPTPKSVKEADGLQDEAMFRFSLAGMQPKLSMSMANERLVLRANGPQGHWIVKLPSRNYPELPEVENATMTWAKLAGFEVPTHFTVDTESLEGVPAAWCDELPKAFAIRRFDRRDDGSKVHQEDLCQGLELLPAHKHGETGISLDGALRFVADVAGEQSAREMSRRIGFVIASGNDDAHLKNWSLAWGNADRPTLTPCYDLVSTITWRDKFGWGMRGGPTLSLGMGKVERFALLDADALQRHAANSGFSWAVAETLQGIERARNAWSMAESGMPQMMREAVIVHWNEVPLLRAFGLPGT